MKNPMLPRNRLLRFFSNNWFYTVVTVLSLPFIVWFIVMLFQNRN
jgi:hypothetical protein